VGAGVPSVAAVVEAIVARVEWAEVDAGGDTAGLRCRVVAIAVEAPAAEARAGTCRDPATAQVVWLQIGTSPAETSTDPKPPPKFNPVRKALGPVLLFFSNTQDALRIADSAHSFHGVHDEIQYYVLRHDSINNYRNQLRTCLLGIVNIL
jgi:hypothetical protein